MKVEFQIIMNYTEFSEFLRKVIEISRDQQKEFRSNEEIQLEIMDDLISDDELLRNPGII